MLRFDLNLSLVLKGTTPFVARFDLAARLGFDSVEFWWPAGEDLGALERAARDARSKVVLFNFDGGDLAAGDRGLMSDQERQGQFRANVPVALELAAKLGCKTINALVGKERPGVDRASQLGLARDNLAWAAELARSAGVTVVVELLNAIETPGYLLRTTKDALALMDAVAAPNVKYLFDAYHVQRTEGNLVDTFRKHRERIGHIQIADSPGRHQPGTGEIHYPYVFKEIESSGYAGFIGCEFSPAGSVAESLAWLPSDRRKSIASADLRLGHKP